MTNLKKITKTLPYDILSRLRTNLIKIGAVVSVKHGVMTVGVVTPEMHRKAALLLR